MRTANPIALVAALCLGSACAAPVAALRPPAAPLPVVPEPLAQPMPKLDGEGVIYVASSEPARPRVRYRDGQLSLNTHCAIRVENQLNRRIPPVYVNGQPIGFC